MTDASPDAATDTAVPPAGTALRRRALALLWGALCHGAFALGGGAMFVGLWFGMTLGQGAVPQPFAWAANLALLAQFRSRPPMAARSLPPPTP